MPSLIARPAASSDAELTRKPLDSLLKLLMSAFWLPDRCFWASSEDTLVWIFIAIGKLLPGEPRSRSGHLVGLHCPSVSQERSRPQDLEQISRGPWPPVAT